MMWYTVGRMFSHLLRTAAVTGGWLTETLKQLTKWGIPHFDDDNDDSDGDLRRGASGDTISGDREEELPGTPFLATATRSFRGHHF
eukprot:9199081-Heterocapsa_arctica.AAC.1